MDTFIVVGIAALAFGPVLLYLGNYRSVWWRRLVLLIVAFLVARYFHWRLSLTVPWGAMDWHGLYMQFIAVIECAWIAELLHAFSFFWSKGSRRRSQSKHDGTLPAELRTASVDVFIPTLNEGPEILERTILAATRLQWTGAMKVHVLDDGRRAWLGDICRQFGVEWVTRPDNKGAKAGNINHALGKTRGNFILMLDADFLAHPEAIQRLMPSMADRKVAIAQAPHHFYNDDPIMRSLGAGEHVSDDQCLFFDRILPARDRGGFSFFCGTCALIRRVALMENGGLPSGSVTEDILLSVHLRRRGWKTRFVDTRVATGLAPETLHAMFVQRCRWARGAIQMLYLRSGLRAPGLKLRERLAFLPSYWVISPIVRIVSLIIPQLYLLYAWLPLQNASVMDLLRYQGPMVIAMGGLAAFVFRHRWSPLLNSIWGDVVGIRIAPNVIRDLIFPFRDMKFHVTPKGRGRSKTALAERIMAVAVAAGVVFTLAALISGPYGRWDDPYVSVSMFWAALNLLRLLAVLTVLWSGATLGTEPKVEIRVRESDGFALIGTRGLRSIAGWRLSEDRLYSPTPFPSPTGTLVRVAPGGGRTSLAEVLPDGTLQFPNTGARAQLLSMLVTLRVDTETPYRPAAAMSRVAMRMFGLGLFARKSEPSA
jgi:cellulose synthase (UDP-forming)